MMLIMNVDATPEQISQAVEIIESRGLKAHLSRGEERTVIGIVGITQPSDFGASDRIFTGQAMPVSPG